MSTHTTDVPRCVQRTGCECRDCVECLSRHPDGATCSACVHAYRCQLIFGLREPETQRFCDWAPSRFMARKVPE